MINTEKRKKKIIELQKFFQDLGELIHENNSAKIYYNTKTYVTTYVLIQDGIDLPQNTQENRRYITGNTFAARELALNVLESTTSNENVLDIFGQHLWVIHTADLPEAHELHDFLTSLLNDLLA